MDMAVPDEHLATGTQHIVTPSTTSLMEVADASLTIPPGHSTAACDLDVQAGPNPVTPHSSDNPSATASVNAPLPVTATPATSTVKFRPTLPGTMTFRLDSSVGSSTHQTRRKDKRGEESDSTIK
jgi:hypothetical protein